MERFVLFMVIVLVNAAFTSEQDMFLEKVGELINRLFGQNVSGCRPVLLSSHPHSSIVSAILRYSLQCFPTVV